MWDVFISHAAEDKEDIARPLAEALANAGLKVWYDDFTLKLGESLSRSIDRGLAGSRYGIVVLSPSFFSKAWPRRELDGLTSREVSSGTIILPIWHKVSRAEVERFSPILADKLRVSTDKGLDVVVREVLRVLKHEATYPPLMKPRTVSRRVFAVAAILMTVLLALGFYYYGVVRRTAGSISGKWVIEATPKTPKTYLDFKILEGRLTETRRQYRKRWAIRQQ